MNLSKLSRPLPTLILSIRSFGFFLGASTALVASMAPVCWDGGGRRKWRRQRWGTEGTRQNTVHVYTVMPIVYTTMSITISTSRPFLAAYAVKATRLTRLAACISTLQNYVRKNKFRRILTIRPSCLPSQTITDIL